MHEQMSACNIFHICTRKNKCAETPDGRCIIANKNGEATTGTFTTEHMKKDQLEDDATTICH